MARGLQKAQSQAKNAGDKDKTPEQRAADRKLAAANSQAQVCQLCRQTFSNVAKEPMLRDHWVSKHPKETDITKAFPHLKACVAVSAAGGAAAAPVDAAKKVGSAAGAPAAAEKTPKQKMDAKKAAALAAAAAGGAPAKKEPKKKTAAAEEAPAVGPEVEETPIVAEVVEPTGAASMDVDCDDAAPEEVAAPVAEPARELTEEERARMETLRVERVAKTAAFAAKEAAKLEEEAAQSVTALIAAGELKPLEAEGWALLCQAAGFGKHRG